MDVVKKLGILADAAKYDASCASSGTAKRNSHGGRGIGSTEGMGICHSYAPDGRCISLLKVLLTNFCIYDCQYCINRRGSDVPRARFAVDELVELTLEFYRRNFIEGLFLSSGIVRNADHTMEQTIEVARRLREDHDFRGYIHLKTIPNASEDLIARAGRYADRLSVNIELPTEQSLVRFAPEKRFTGIRASMARIRAAGEESAQDSRAPKFAPAGQSTQLIVGADASNDDTILGTSRELYTAHRLRRVYYSGYSPIPHSTAALPATPAPLLREHRLYQADWLMRFYGFELAEIQATNAARGGMLALDRDPKLDWALSHPEMFPVDVNRADRSALLRVPGFGARTVARIVKARRFGRLRLADLQRFKVSIAKCSPFIVTPDHRPSARVADMASRAHRAEQLALW